MWLRATAAFVGVCVVSLVSPLAPALASEPFAVGIATSSVSIQGDVVSVRVPTAVVARQVRLVTSGTVLARLDVPPGPPGTTAQFEVPFTGSGRVWLSGAGAASTTGAVPPSIYVSRSNAESWNVTVYAPGHASVSLRPSVGAAYLLSSETLDFEGIAYTRAEFNVSGTAPMSLSSFATSSAGVAEATVDVIPSELHNAGPQVFRVQPSEHLEGAIPLVEGLTRPTASGYVVADAVAPGSYPVSQVLTTEVSAEGLVRTTLSSAAAQLVIAGDDSDSSSQGEEPTLSTPEAESLRPQLIPVVAVNDKVSVPEGREVTISVLANDSGEDLRITGWSRAGHGSVSCSTATCVYSPKRGFTGTDSFTYNITGKAGRSSATVTVNVLGSKPQPSPTPEPTPQPTPNPTPDPTPKPNPKPTPSPKPLPPTGVDASGLFLAGGLLLLGSAGLVWAMRRGGSKYVGTHRK